MRNILFLCTGNSCRSQMAEGFAKHLKGDKYNFYSAGTQKHGLNSFAIKVMSEVNIDITKQKSKTISELPKVYMDYVFTVCSDAHENCPFYTGGKIIHIGFDDPPKLTEKLSDEEMILVVYRRVRNEIERFINTIEKYLDEDEI